jgi:dihydrofolate synthase/folylpolyglutamate synthase
MAVGTESGIEWLMSLSRFGIKPGLERTRRVLDAFENPQAALKFFHVAGTNGKGSVCAFLTSLLAVTCKVGSFTSPSFDGYLGRFVVNGEPISSDAFAVLAERVRDVSERETPDNPLTEFEALTVMAILHFAQHHVEAVVWETGLGGRYDSTNVVEPWVTAITNIGYDHVEILGPTIRHIAQEKAGIVKSGIPVVTAAQGEPLHVIRTVAAAMHAPVYEFGTAFGGTRWMQTNGSQSMTYRGISKDVFAVPIPLFGAHQCANAAVALAMYEIACRRGGFTELSDSQLRQAMAETTWPGRFETLVWNGASVVLDGAHNPDGARALANALADFQSLKSQPNRKWRMVIGVLQDKDVDDMLSPVLPYAESVIVAQPESPRAKNAQDLSNLIKTVRNDLEVCVVSSVADAMQTAIMGNHDVCCWGSLYTVHEARNAMKHRQNYGSEDGEAR